jgi:class 3 adenylate cyclase/DNA-binding winged helix-turn-helix (wHTH) protein
MIYTFADCELDAQRLTLRRAGHLRHLRPKAFAMLLYLVMHRDRVVDKQEIYEQVWPEQFISDATVESTLRAVRQAVGDSGKTQRLIQTFHRHGYRLVADVSEHGEERLAVGPQAVGEQLGQTGTAEGATVLPPVQSPEALLPEAQAQRRRIDPGDGESGVLSPLGRADAEHRHLTVLCCDLVDVSVRPTPGDLDTLHDVIRAAHTTCAVVVAHFEGYVAQYRGDGLLAYFGFPQAHEDDAQRAVRAGLAIVETIQHSADQATPLQVRVGIHTGPVVVGALGAEAGEVPLALGTVPQDAARLLMRAAPQTVVLSAATWHLVAGWFVGEMLADQALPGMLRPESVYRVMRESGAQSRLDLVAPERLTPLVGRSAELAMLQERWAQDRDGLGQVVLISGEAGIGKSHLAETLRAQVAAEGSPQIVLRCSPYHTHSGLFPVREHLRRVARIRPEDTPATKLDKIEQMLCGYCLTLEEVVPLFADLLAVPLGQRYPPIGLTPAQHKQHTYAALLAWLCEEAERQPMLVLYEDLHWADPSSLELLRLWIEQVPTIRVLMLLLCRPEFQPPWDSTASITQLTLSRFTRSEEEQMLAALVGNTVLPAEVREQVIARADGVPLFLEELVKMLLESGLLQAPPAPYGRPAPPLAIPATLADALMARLDRLGSARALAQLGATWGREFTYAQVQSLVPLEEATLQQ